MIDITCHPSNTQIVTHAAQQVLGPDGWTVSGSENLPRTRGFLFAEEAEMPDSLKLHSLARMAGIYLTPVVLRSETA